MTQGSKLNSLIYLKTLKNWNKHNKIHKTYYTRLVPSGLKGRVSYKSRNSRIIFSSNLTLGFSSQFLVHQGEEHSIPLTHNSWLRSNKTS